MTEVEQNNDSNYVFQPGYHGGVASDIPLDQLNKCTDNKIDMDFTLNKKASIDSDPGSVTLETQQSQGSGLYRLDNTYGCDCGLKKARDVQLSQPFVNFQGGLGWIGEKGCLIDSDSNVRFDILTNKKYINQLPHLVNQGFFGKGSFDVDTESIIRDSKITKLDRPCNVLAGSSTLQYSITPMISRLESEVQDPLNLIPEDSMKSWPRGGLPSRQMARNRDYINRCKEKEANRK